VKGDKNRGFLGFQYWVFICNTTEDFKKGNKKKLTSLQKGMVESDLTLRVTHQVLILLIAVVSATINLTAVIITTTGTGNANYYLVASSPVHLLQ
jgi:hypothetical protein